MSFIVPKDARSWLEVPSDSHFPIQNLPIGVFAIRDFLEEGDCIGVPIGNWVLNLTVLESENRLPNMHLSGEHGLRPLISGGRRRFEELREAVFHLLHISNQDLASDLEFQERILVPMDQVIPRMPMQPPAFIDFYSGINHAGNVGRMFRPDQPPLLPNYRWLPVGYNGRASSVVASGSDIRRPNGQTKRPDADAPTFGPTKELDFELEMGFFLGEGSEMGRPRGIEEAESMIFGYVLVNDWSARDAQRWEYQPLGPFLAKSFGTSISPWIVSPDALEPFRVQGPVQDPLPLPHLAQMGAGHYDITLEVSLQTSMMSAPQVISLTNYRELYWSAAQQLAHQMSNGTNVQPGDLYASGTISGTAPDSFGSLLELTWKGERPIQLESGEQRSFLEDEDTLIMSGYCQGEGYRVGFGEVRGTIVAADA